MEPAFFIFVLQKTIFQYIQIYTVLICGLTAYAFLLHPQVKGQALLGNNIFEGTVSDTVQVQGSKAMIINQVSSFLPHPLTPGRFVTNYDGKLRTVINRVDMLKGDIPQVLVKISRKYRQNEMIPGRIDVS